MDLNSYRLVWNDEFDGNKLDTEKWGFAPKMGGSEDLLLSEDGKTVRVENGALILTADAFSDPMRPSVKYSVNYSVTTFKTMSFVYGYVEMRARVPFKHGAWPSFWMVTTDALGSTKGREYETEVDIFEVFSNTVTAVPNIHKWYKNGENKGLHNQFNGFEGKQSARYVFKDNKTACDWHVYGFEWTAQRMTMFVDGEAYMTYDLSYNFDHKSDMGGFHQPMYLILNNHLFTENLYWVPSADQIVKPEDLPSVYEIDYIRLYQQPGIGSLTVKEQNYNI